jgi:S-DNA-T family DNA segregation ATPase FtsK/SpoIIIE
MARTATRNGRTALLPDGATEMLRRRFAQAAGLALAALACILTLALLSYSPSDPSLNNATGAAAHNLMGRGGAYIADLLLQTFGIAALVPAAALIAWGWRLVSSKGLSLLWARILVLIAGVMLAAVFVGAFPAPEAWPLRAGLGGVSGTVLLNLTVEAATPFGIAAAGPLTAAIAGIGAILTLGFASGLGPAEWRGIGRLPVRGAAVLIGAIEAWRERLQERRVPGEGNDEPDAKAGGAHRKEPRLDHTAKPKDLVSAKPSPPKPGRRARDARQGNLDLPVADLFQAPPLDLLEPPREGSRIIVADEKALTQNARLLESVLEDFGVRGEIVKVRPGPVVTLYELEPAPGTKTSRVVGLADDIARSMSALSVRIAVVPGQNVIGIELPNSHRETVNLRELLATDAVERSTGELVLVLGKDIGGTPMLVDLARMPHLLIAGTTGSGKSVAINTMILSLLYRLGPDRCRFIMIDPKMLELSVYEGIPNLLAPVVTDPGKAVVALKWAVREMEERYRAMAQLGVRNIDGYNQRLAAARKKGEVLTRRIQTGFDEAGAPVFEEITLDLDPLPFIVVVVDEMADLMLVAGKDLEAAVQRLAQMARAAGIHLIMATQRPSVDVITGTIKANFPTRVSFQVTTKIDSRTILGEQGAEQLLGHGDMLYMAGGGRITRVHGPFVSDEEVERVVAYLKSQSEPAYDDAVTEEIETGAVGFDLVGSGEGGDELYDQAVSLVAREGKASTSFIQRHLQIGYNRAARIIETMEVQGVVSKADRVGRREVLIGEH